MDLNNPNDKATIQDTLKQGMKTDFWSIICQALDNQVEEYQKEEDGDNLKSLPADQYKVESVILKARKKTHEELKKYPMDIINSLENPNKEPEKNYDPYE